MHCMVAAVIIIHVAALILRDVLLSYFDTKYTMQRLQQLAVHAAVFIAMEIVHGQHFHECTYYQYLYTISYSTEQAYHN